MQRTRADVDCLEEFRRKGSPSGEMVRAATLPWGKMHSISWNLVLPGWPRARCGKQDTESYVS